MYCLLAVVKGNLIKDLLPGTGAKDVAFPSKEAMEGTRQTLLMD